MKKTIFYLIFILFLCLGKSYSESKETFSFKFTQKDFIFAGGKNIFKVLSVPISDVLLTSLVEIEFTKIGKIKKSSIKEGNSILGKQLIRAFEWTNLELPPETKNLSILFKITTDYYEGTSLEIIKSKIDLYNEKSLISWRENKTGFKGLFANVKKAKEEEERLKQEKLAASKKAIEEAERREQENLAAKKLLADLLQSLEDSTDWNKLFDEIANIWLSTTIPTPGMNEAKIHLCLWKKINRSYLTGNYLVDDSYNMGQRIEVYDKINPMFSQFEQTVGETIKLDVNCDHFLRRFQKF